MRLALYQPDIPQNTGALLRIAACVGVPLDIVEPCGFPLDDKRLRRSAMDYGAGCVVERHASWARFLETQNSTGRRVVLLTTTATVSHSDFRYSPQDTLLLGRESAGVPPEVVAAVPARVRIPMAHGLRSLNVSVAGAIVLAEALRQSGIFDGKTTI
jgi:tRNA (cytidine/uridine-2'-O-)-methyltransferase